jgi:uncharacterized protein (TIGR02594 family)
MTAPAWYIVARRYIGTREIKGPKHEPKILAWWKAIKRGGIKDDETPWCAAFVGGVLEEVGLMSSRFESAASYLDWGVPLKKPTLGAVVVLTRPGGNHVGFFAGIDRDGHWLLLGGNQSDSVSVAAFPPTRVMAGGVRWPEAVPMPDHVIQPLWSATATSMSEA